MGAWNTLLPLALCLLPAAAAAGEFQAGIGYVPLITSTPDLHINYRPSQSHFQFGYKYQQWTEEYVDSITRLPMTRSMHTRSGPTLAYLAEIDTDASIYYGIELLHWAVRETPLATGGGSATASSNDLYFGAGRTGHFGDGWYYNLGLFVSPTADLSSPSRRKSNGTSSGSFDMNLQLGLFF